MKTTVPAKRPAAQKNPKNAPARRPSASKRATEIARRGEPLNADTPRERSPKQENL